MKLKIHGIVEESIVDGPGIRYVVFMQGCNHNCKGCHNPKTHDINGGFLKDASEILASIKENPLISGVTFSGGEPMLHAGLLSKLCDDILVLNKNIMVYSGFTYEQICNDDEKFDFLKKCHILVDGKYEESEKSLLLTFKGSKNQRIIDIKKTLETNEIVELEF